MTLIPVISLKALARVLDSYSWVVMVSDTTLISLTPCALSGGRLDEPLHLGQLLVLDSVEGWNSESIHFCASGSPAQAADVPIRAMAARRRACEIS